MNPGELTEFVIVQTPAGESSADDRSATGFVDQHGATPSDVLPGVWAKVTEASFMDLRRAGGEAGQQLLRVVIHNDVEVLPKQVVYRVEKAETLEIVSVAEETHHADYLRLICKRAV